MLKLQSTAGSPGAQSTPRYRDVPEMVEPALLAAVELEVLAQAERADAAE